MSYEKIVDNGLSYLMSYDGLIYVNMSYYHTTSNR